MKLYKSSFILTLLILFCLSTNAMKSYAIHLNCSREVGMILSDTTKDVKIPAEFPGGQKEWTKYIAKTVDYDLPIRNGAPVGMYQVIVSFVVDTDGSIINVRAENDFGYGMAEEAVRALKKAPKWIPASINGVKVIYRHRQAVVFYIYEN